MSARRPTCRVVDVDGTPVRVRGRHPMPADEAGALAEVIRAARAHLASLPMCACGHTEQFHAPDDPRPCRVRVRADGATAPCDCAALAVIP